MPVGPLHRAPGTGKGGHLGRLKGDSYGNALAETVNGLYKAELVHQVCEINVSRYPGRAEVFGAPYG